MTSRPLIGRKSYAYERIIESKLQYFNISGEIPSGPAAFPFIKLLFTATYSSVVKILWIFVVRHHY